LAIESHPHSHQDPGIFKKDFSTPGDKVFFYSLAHIFRKN